jgi:putative aldouronate transport system substrate-binding protein
MDIQTYTALCQRAWSAYEIAMNNAVAEPVVPVTLSTAGPVSQTLIDKHNALLAQLLVCSSGDFDRIWDAGITEWMASGARTVLEERAAKYADAFQEYDTNVL